MAADSSREIEIVVNALLKIGDWVTEVSRNHVMTRIWARKDHTLLLSETNYLGKKILEIGNAEFMVLADTMVESAFLTGEDGYIEYAAVFNNTDVLYGLRILTCHPDKNCLFFVLENISAKKVTRITEDKWKLALDASGDGMWDMDMETNVIFFSDKWHEIFGYEAAEILTSEDWVSKIHPEDLAANRRRFNEYLDGKTPSYTTEMRYLCKDGSYKWILSRGIVISSTAAGKPKRIIGTHTDITERKNVEEKYAGTAQLLAKLINNLHSSILVTDENWKVIFGNQVFLDQFASSGDPNELIGMDMLKNLATRKYAYKDPENFYNKTIDLVTKKQISLNEELEMADGRIICRDYIPLILGQNSKGGIWKFKDITDKRNVEKRFEEQRLFYERILNAIPADIAVFDKDYRYLFVNKNAFKNDDLRQWMIGKTDADYARYSNRSQSFVDTRFGIYNDAISGKKVEYIEKLVAKDGSVGHHLRLLRPVYHADGALEFLMAYGLEVTDLIVAQEELKTSIDTFSSAFGHSGIGMALIGLDSKWLDVNQVLCDLTGYSKEELLQLNYHDITYLADDELDRHLINKLLGREISTYTIEKRYLSKKNKIILVSLTVSLVWKDAAPKFFIAQVVDITEKKELEISISRRNMELEAARISLVNKISQLEELSNIIAHNLRGPAGNLKLFSGILMDRQNNVVPAGDNQLNNAFATEDLVKFIYDSSTSLMDSLATLMEITQIKLNKEIPYNDCEVEWVINNILVQLQSTIYEKKAVIKSELEVKFTRYPKVYLENILYNLISNALKYSSTTAPAEITISTRVLKNKKTQVVVKDNGIGIDMEKYGDKVFKLNQIFHAGYDSKGVGLYITKTQIESLGGSIEIKSKPGEGCEFTVTL
jgi:PAS domain S-box-containing protein